MAAFQTARRVVVDLQRRRVRVDHEPVGIEPRGQLEPQPETQPTTRGNEEPGTERRGIRDRRRGDLAHPLEHEGGGHVRGRRHAVTLSHLRAQRRAPRLERVRAGPHVRHHVAPPHGRGGGLARHGRERQRPVDEPDDGPDGVGTERRRGA